MLLKLGGHLYLHFLGSFSGFLCKILPVSGIDNTSGGVDYEPTLPVHSVLTNLRETAPLSTYTRYEQKVIRDQFAYSYQRFGPGGTYHLHHVGRRAPGGTGADHAFIELFA